MVAAGIEFWSRAIVTLYILSKPPSNRARIITGH